jgi:hypothetical protein
VKLGFEASGALTLIWDVLRFAQETRPWAVRPWLTRTGARPCPLTSGGRGSEVIRFSLPPVFVRGDVGSGFNTPAPAPDRGLSHALLITPTWFQPIQRITSPGRSEEQHGPRPIHRSRKPMVHPSRGHVQANQTNDDPAGVKRELVGAARAVHKDGWLTASRTLLAASQHCPKSLPRRFLQKRAPNRGHGEKIPPNNASIVPFRFWPRPAAATAFHSRSSPNSCPEPGTTRQWTQPRKAAPHRQRSLDQLDRQWGLVP